MRLRTNVFHVSLLVTPEADEEEYDVEQLLDSRMVARQLQYLVKWENYQHSSSNTWERESRKTSTVLRTVLRNWSNEGSTTGPDKHRRQGPLVVWGGKNTLGGRGDRSVGRRGANLQSPGSVRALPRRLFPITDGVRFCDENKELPSFPSCSRRVGLSSSSFVDYGTSATRTTSPRLARQTRDWDLGLRCSARQRAVALKVPTNALATTSGASDQVKSRR
ncbi:hypothetical protein B0T17DRAFT_584544 [Bombardia bombarda]|uniref:Chromo domain-containing protein n=1 Tax=Bombardia bombarda TaxID=252184 RepID=A0AA39T2E2_9PEZI|nr:hypothetical protein B0T17DRAFT_584544 [Bombardia bombarda]